MSVKIFVIGIGVLFIIGVSAFLITRKGTTENTLGYQTTQTTQPTPTLGDQSQVQPTSAATTSASVSPSVMPSPTKGESMSGKQYQSPPPLTINPAKKYTATMTTTKGKMTFTLFAKDVPNTVNNFVFLGKEGFYAGSPFHRIMKGFMIQGGDPTGTGRGGPGYQFKDEPVTRDYVRGTIAMANAGPNTNGSQFFVMHADYALPKNYVIFGTIEKDDADSLKTLDAIANTPVTVSETGEQSKPTEVIKIESVSIKEE